MVEKETSEKEAIRELTEAVRSLKREIADLRQTNLDLASDGILARARTGRWRSLEKPAEPVQPEPPEKKPKGKAEGAARQVLAIYYLLEALNVDFDIHGQKQHIKDLIALITGRHEKTVEKELGNVDDAAKPEDLEFILPLFEKVRLKTIANRIKKISKSSVKRSATYSRSF